MTDETKHTPELTFTMLEADALLQCFGGEPAEWTVRKLDAGAIRDPDDGPSPAGLWAHLSDYPEEGCIYLGPADDPDAMPESSIVASAPALAARVAELDAEVARLREALRELLNGWPRGHLPETAKRGYRALGDEK